MKIVNSSETSLKFYRVTLRHIPERSALILHTVAHRAANVHIATRNGDYRRGWDWLIRFIAPYAFTQLGTTGNTALPLFYTLYSSPSHTYKDSQSSIVVYWQRIYSSLTVISNHT
jgi:hypothetical protein